MITDTHGAMPGGVTSATKAVGAINTNGLHTDTNDLNFATGQRPSKAIATKIAQLALAGHAVQRLKCGDFLICKWGYSQYAQYVQDPEALQRLARKPREVLYRDMAQLETYLGQLDHGRLN